MKHVYAKHVYASFGANVNTALVIQANFWKKVFYSQRRTHLRPDCEEV